MKSKQRVFLELEFLDTFKNVKLNVSFIVNVLMVKMSLKTVWNLVKLTISYEFYPEMKMYNVNDIYNPSIVINL